MKHHTRIGYMLGLMLLLVGSSPADEYEISLMGGGHRFRDGSDLRDQFVIRGTLGRHLGNRHGIEVALNLAISSAATRRTPTAGAEPRTEAVVYGIDYAFYLRSHRYEHRERQLVPYVGTGIGRFVPYGDNVHDDQSFIANAAVGAKYLVGRRLSFQAALRIYSTHAHDHGAGTHRIRVDSLTTGMSLKI